MFNPSTQKTYYFPCNAWLEKTKEGGLAGCRKELVAGALCVVVVGGRGVGAGRVCGLVLFDSLQCNRVAMRTRARRKLLCGTVNC